MDILPLSLGILRTCHIVSLLRPIMSVAGTYSVKTIDVQFWIDIKVCLHLIKTNCKIWIWIWISISNQQKLLLEYICRCGQCLIWLRFEVLQTMYGGIYCFTVNFWHTVKISFSMLSIIWGLTIAVVGWLTPTNQKYICFIYAYYSMSFCKNG